MKVTIITATYNSSSTLARCIASVDEQTYQEIEHLIIDGSSTDNTMEIIQKNPGRITKIVSEPDKGIYDALNKGVKLATGDIIGFLHSDDCFHSHQTLENMAFSSPQTQNNPDGIYQTLENIVMAFSSPQTQNNPDGIYGDLVFVDQKDSHKIVRYWKSQPFEPKLLRQGWMPPHPTLFMRRKVYEKHRLFNINLKCAADYDYILRVFQDQSLYIYYIPEVITVMGMGGVSTTGFKSLINKKKEDYWVLKSNLEFHVYPLLRVRGKPMLLSSGLKLLQYLRLEWAQYLNCFFKYHKQH